MRVRHRRWIHSPVLQFALSGLFVVAVVGVISARLLEHAARGQVLRDAEDVTRVAGQGIVGPALTPAVLRGDPSALAGLDRIVRARVLLAPVVRVKLWSADGRIVYSDERRLIGERYPLGADELRVLRDGGVEAEISDLTRPENRFERPLHRLREVYLPLRGPGGRRLLFEEYLRDSSIVADGQRLFGSLAPVLIGALLVLALVQIPLAASLARRLQRGRRERELLLEQAVAASALERERIARDLHDGVVQQLAGVSYELSAASAEALGGGAPAGATLRRAGDQIRRVMRQLRTLLVELYPETLQRQGLEAALTDLLARVHAHAIATELEIEPAVRLDPAGEALVFRTAQEALRNVTAHADARSVAVRLTSHGDRCALHVIDDGVGMQPPGDDRPRLGLRMLGDLARQAGGELSVRDAPQGGTALELRLPARR